MSESSPTPRTDPPQESRRERKKRETRMRILGTALELFREHGFESTTVERIAEGADVSRQTFFNHFPEKSAVLSELGDAMTAQFLESLDRALDMAGSTPARLALLFTESAARLLRAPDLSRFLLFETFAKRRDISERRSHTAQVHEQIAALLANGIARGDVRDDLPLALLSEIVAGAFIEILLTWMVEPDYPLEDRLHDAASFLSSALAPPVTTGGADLAR